MRKILEIILLFLIFNISFACMAADTDTPIKIFHLKNGHKVIIKEIHSNPIVTLDTWVKTGTADETAKNNGVSHFLEHLMFKGTPTHKPGEMEAMLESMGARCNAATSKDFTHYYVTIANEHVGTAIELYADMLQNPAIPLGEMNKERKVVQEEIRRANDDPKRILIMDLFELIFKEHPYKLDTLGPHEVIETISREEVYKYYDKQYVPSNLTTVIVGDIKAEEVLSLMKKHFNKEFKPAPKVLKSLAVKIEPEPTKPVEKITKGSYKSGYAYWGYKGVPITSIKETYALDMAASIIGGSRSSRLYQNLQENQNLVSDIGASHYSLRDDSVFIISADFEPEKFPQVKAAVLEEIDKLRNELVTEEELKRAKTLAKREFVYDNESVENISNSLGYTATLTGSIENYKKHTQYVDNVTVYDIQKAAQKYLKPERLALTALLPEETEVNIVLSDKKVIKDTTRSRLNNGITLITNKNSSNDIISMSVFMKGGAYLEPVPGTANILAKTLLYGTKHRPYTKLIQEIENAGISISPDSGNDYFEISVKSTKNDFNKAFEILADIIKNSTFEEKYVEKNKNDLLVEIRKSRDYPVSISTENFIEMIYKDHPYGNIGKKLEKTVPAITRDQVVEYWDEAFIPENMVVSVAGNVEHTEIANKLLAAFPSTGKKPPKITYNGKFSAFDKNQEVFANKKSEAAWIFMGWPVGNNQDNKEFITFKVIEAMLADGLSSRLHKTFREDQGLAYRVGCSYSPKMDKGHFVLYIGTEPKNIELIKGKFLKEVERLKTEHVSQKELRDSKNKLIGSYVLSQETNQNKAHLLGVFEVIDKEFGFNYDFPDLINKVTSEDIMTVANKYFNNPYALSITAPQSTGKKE